MFKGFKVLKTYYGLAKINPYLLLGEFLTLLLPSILSIISTVLTANLITAITVYDFNKAIFLLSLDFGFILISAISYLIYHFLSAKINKTIVINYQNYLYLNVKQNPNIKSISLSVFNNISSLVSFNKNLLYKICFFIKSIVLLGIIVYYNLIIGLALVGVSFLSYFLLKITDKKIQQNTKSLSDNQLQSLELFNSIRQGTSVEQNYNLETSLKDKYFGYVDDGIKTDNRISLFYNINNNFITLILKTTVFVTTLFLITQIKSTTLTLSLYLILTPYLSSSAQNLISFFDIFSEMGIIENILNEFESYKFQGEKINEKPIELSTYNTYFFQTTLNEKNKPKLSKLNLKIEFGKLVNFVGEAGCGKRAVFYLLNKTCNPTSGSVFIDNKNISDIPPERFNKIVSCTTKEPFFYGVSIFENLMLVCPNKTKIQTVLKSFGLTEQINKLPNKLNSLVSESNSSALKFFLGLARCYLSDAKILCIYELPNFTNKHDLFVFKKILSFLKKKCTVLLFSHSDEFSMLADNTYYFENGNIKNKTETQS